jgi:ParB family chromosome partitioning protein
MAQYDALIAEHGDEPEAEIAEQLDSLWQQIEAIDEAALAWRPEDRARAGAVISIDYDGDAQIERGLIRPEEARRLRSVAASVADEGEREPKPSGLSATLTESLTAERTAALRAVMIEHPAMRVPTRPACRCG